MANLTNFDSKVQFIWGGELVEFLSSPNCRRGCEKKGGVLMQESSHGKIWRTVNIEYRGRKLLKPAARDFYRSHLWQSFLYLTPSVFSICQRVNFGALRLWCFAVPLVFVRVANGWPIVAALHFANFCMGYTCAMCIRYNVSKKKPALNQHQKPE